MLRVGDRERDQDRDREELVGGIGFQMGNKKL